MSGQRNKAGRRSREATTREALCTTLIVLLTFVVILLFFLQQWRDSGVFQPGLTLALFWIYSC